MNKELLRTIKFTLFSISAGIIEICVFTLMYNYGKMLWISSYIVALILSVLWNFTFNRYYTFMSASNIPLAMFLIGVYYAIFAPLSTWGGHVLKNDMGWNGNLVTIFLMAINFVTEYLYDRFFVYGGKVDTNKRARKNRVIKAVLFDMDGTILNTIDDLRIATNYALEKTGHKYDFDNEAVGMFYGSGVETAILRALAAEDGMPIDEVYKIGDHDKPEQYGFSSDEINSIAAVYRPFYNFHCNDNTKPFDGINELLVTLREKGIKTAVVSNKPDETVQILAKEQFGGMFDVALGGKEGVELKPARDMLDTVLAQIGCTTEEAIYVGDTDIDILTGKNAKMPVVCFSWGFRTLKFLKKHGAKHIVNNTKELLEFIDPTIK